MQRAVMAWSDCLRPPGDSRSSAGQRNFLDFTSTIRDLLRSKQPHGSVRTMEGAGEVGEEEEVSRLRLEEDDGQEKHQCPALCDALHGTVQDKDNSPGMRAALGAQVGRVYRFQTEDGRWLLVREQMSETPLSFSVPRQILSALIQEHQHRVLILEELGELSPHWDGLRGDVIERCNHLTERYGETLAEMEQLSGSCCFKSSRSKSDPRVRFVPTNLHSQRMEVTSPDSVGVWYEVITFGAPADHHQGFKQGGLRRLLGCSEVAGSHDQSSPGSPLLSPASYSPEEHCRARELLASVTQLQPLIFGPAEELLSVSVETEAARLEEVLSSLKLQTGRFVHALKDELVKAALLAMYERRGSAHSNGRLWEDPPTGEPRRDPDYDQEEEWDRVWANVAKSLSCIIAMVDRLQGRDRPDGPPEEEEEEEEEETSSQNTDLRRSSCSAASWQEQLLPLVITLRDCVREAVGGARAAMTFVVLQGAASATAVQWPAQVVQRRHAVFSQALSAVVCGFLLKLHGGVEDPDFLRQLHAVGLLVQFEALLSTYGEEVGMLEDMDVGVADLRGVVFAIAEARSEQPGDLLPALSGSWGGFVVEVPLPAETFRLLPEELKCGSRIRVEPVLFNVGINQQQSLAERFGDRSLQEGLNRQSCQRLKVYCDSLTDALPHMAGIQSLPDLLSSLGQSVESRKRKNVEVLWAAAAVCRQVNGVRLTSCKSAKDRTAMSVTLEQCTVLRERHALGRRQFGGALDCMRRSRISWGQMLGCYAHSEFTISGLDPGDRPLALRGPRLPRGLAPKAPRWHLYPVAFLLVTSHLLVLWLIFSLVILLPKYQ